MSADLTAPATAPDSPTDAGRLPPLPELNDAQVAGLDDPELLRQCVLAQLPAVQSWCAVANVPVMHRSDITRPCSPVWVSMQQF